MLIIPEHQRPHSSSRAGDERKVENRKLSSSSYNSFISSFTHPPIKCTEEQPGTNPHALRWGRHEQRERQNRSPRMGRVQWGLAGAALKK